MAQRKRKAERPKLINHHLEEAFCVSCGRTLNKYIGREAPEEWYAATGFTHYCLDCQEFYYDALAEKTGEALAYFYCCIAFNVPFEIEAVPRDENLKSPWIEYLDQLRRNTKSRGEEELRGFLEGITDITKVFGADLDGGEFGKVLSLEALGRAKKPGTAKQREKWGPGPSKKPYTAKDYQELDRIYRALSADLTAQGGLSDKQEYILKDCTTLEIEKQNYIEAGMIDKAQKINNMIQTNLASENLRKKDEKPIEDIRIDSIVEALEKKGYMKNGKLLSYEKLLEKLRGDTPIYPYTKDAADQMLLYIINTSKANDGLPELSTLPDEYRIKDEHGEFAALPSQKEKEAYEKLGIIRMPEVKRGIMSDMKSYENAGGEEFGR